MKIALVKTENGFVPAFDSDYELAKKIGLGETREFETKKNRNLKHHRKFFALMRLALELLPESKNEEASIYKFSFKTENDVLVYVKMKLGLYKQLMITKSGNTVLIPDSISFTAMKQDEFEDFYNKVVDVIINLVGAEREILENELVGFM